MKNCAHNPVPQAAPGAVGIGHSVDNSIPLSIFPIATDKFCICFCGLPGRGKTHISRRLARYLSFFHAVPVEVFNVSEYRRKLCGEFKEAVWFDPANTSSKDQRQGYNEKAIADMVTFLQNNSNGVAIFDATNTTHDQRNRFVEISRPTGAKIIFIEVSNDDEILLQENYTSVVSTSPEYEGMDCAASELDYVQRVKYYASNFESIDADGNHPIEGKWSYFKCDHSRHHFMVHRIRGYLPLKVVHFIMNLRTSSHAFYLSRHGQSEYNAIGRIGGDSGLSTHGINYAKNLAEFVEDNISLSCKDSNGDHVVSEGEIPTRLWTSTMRRTRETTQFINQTKILLKDADDQQIEWLQMRPRAWHHLDELFAGACDGMTYEEIEEQFPEEFERREQDKLAYRYPRGESYLDVIARLEPIIMEMERHREPLLIVGHQGILRIIYAFYMGLSRAEAPYVSVPLNCVLQLVPTAFSCAEKRHTLYNPQKALISDGQDEPTPMSLDVNPQSH
eukprot:CAMPEP_0119035422 /NCGR_PEP_ID=MMETSP1177-20130426/2404_1 /TAXON_ID=2985 /ORGANISM="Ochromonas sp, Strain CCMP1899" /LENGTH=503 /DNA_ID=CAMNT_0006993635 /DNA_START=129 /DNA_END=1640 /DNA_ORIENTATION=-